jgi:hypothetical protein
MPEIITYSLRGNHENSDEYYQTISSFCDDVLTHAWGQALEVLASFQSWCGQAPQVSPRSREEAAFELLSLGVLWRVYNQPAASSRAGFRKASAWMYDLRKRSKFLKPAADLLRGWLAGLSSPRPRSGLDPVSFTLKNMELLLEWLAATGEFSEEVRLFSTWRDFLSNQPQQAVSRTLQQSVELAGWFEASGLESLGKFTPNVEAFLSRAHPRYRWREDNLFTGRQRVEYHLNMLATELLNRGFRQRFLETEKKILIVPPCMKAKPEDECQATATPLGELCARCTPACRVNQVTSLGEKHGFQVFIIPDKLNVFSGDGSAAAPGRSTGLVGVSCPLTNASGGWEMKRLGVPAQGLLLDYCGCTYHWHKEGIPTDLNFRQLLRLVDANP